MNIKIFSCHHLTPKTTLATEIFQTLVSGVVPPSGSHVITDINGRNIANRPKFCELRQQYFVWQNLLSNYDYVGFEHYRRAFYLDPLPFDVVKSKYPLIAEARQHLVRRPQTDVQDVWSVGQQQYFAMREAFGPEENKAVRSWISNYDIICAFQIYWRVDLEVKCMHPLLDFPKFWDILSERWNPAWKRVFGQSLGEFPPQWSAHLNMYIMRSELFSEYMEFLFGILLDLDNSFPEAPARIWGHFSERMFGSFIIQKCLEQPTLRVHRQPILFFRAGA